MLNRISAAPPRKMHSRGRPCFVLINTIRLAPMSAALLNRAPPARVADGMRGAFFGKLPQKLGLRPLVSMISWERCRLRSARSFASAYRRDAFGLLRRGVGARWEETLPSRSQSQKLLPERVRFFRQGRGYPLPRRAYLGFRRSGSPMPPIEAASAPTGAGSPRPGKASGGQHLGNSVNSYTVNYMALPPPSSE
jgi:hypothetical protein